ncbi:hypothetical protein H5410_014524 [Solanum commersonii]|uniref:Cupin type-1 domain-containing protein n=1 Tax=Solanum commersonii TaxID=4109 RepID=A0A9J5ZRN3_SOLCO|nr:hypothetical protein H5410_014524 [Solanum commersonii]
MTFKSLVLIIAIMAVLSSMSHASDPSPLQDFCVAVDDSKNAVFVNGKFCKNPMYVTADDFFRPGLNMAGNTSNQLGSGMNLRWQAEFLPSLRVHSMLDLSFEPRSKYEEQTLYQNLASRRCVCFRGLIHFQFNVGKTNAIAFLWTRLPKSRVITIANAVFGSDPPINDNVLAKAFQIENKVVDYLQSQFWWDNN